MNASLYSCEVIHERREPVQHRFSSRMFMFYLDLDQLDRDIARNPLVSRNRWNIYSFYDEDHLSWNGEDTVSGSVRSYLRDQGIAEEPARILLLTSLRVFGYVFNPVSFYVCLDSQNDPLCILVEVHNTFGEMKPYLIQKHELRGGAFSADRRKQFYISPFSDLDHTLRLKLQIPGERLSMFVAEKHARKGNQFFYATLTGRRHKLTVARLLGYSLRFPLITVKVITMIHWHALLLYLKGAPVYRKSARPEAQVGILPNARDLRVH